MHAIDQSTYVYAKGSCYICGQAHDLVDLDVVIEGEGCLCICRPCIREAATMLGIPLKDLESKAAVVDDALAEIESVKQDLRTERKAHRATKAALKEAKTAPTVLVA